ncbi:unnamed protein product [Pylaiella littoralis]
MTMTMTMTMLSTRWVWLLMMCWSATADTLPPKTTPTTTLTHSPASPAFLAPTSFNHHHCHHQQQQQQQHHHQLLGSKPILIRDRSPAEPLARATRAAPRPRGGRAVPACTSDNPMDEVQCEGENKHLSSGSRRGSNMLGFFSTVACSSAFPRSASAAVAAAAAAAAEVVGDAGGGEMGARLDAPAAISFGAVVVAFAFLQARIRTAVRARTARRDYEVLFKGMKSKQLAGQADEEEVALVEECMSQLLREEQEARMVDIFGIPFNLVIPDGGAGGEQGTGAREAQQGRTGAGSTSAGKAGSDGIREVMRAKTESDLRDGKAREEEMSPGATLKVAALWLVLISQLWLLLVLWNDPMGPATSAFLKD